MQPVFVIKYGLHHLNEIGTEAGYLFMVIAIGTIVSSLVSGKYDTFGRKSKEIQR
ncbi:hypothetical protein [Oceanobacillus sp. CFH 90083]|uniref:hypothetical protein n=1 Tax=Oceanobacillus sp. CFH 90083 TaxID=2592336 RepID=UPI00188323AD|nr:hypothetical protein [Oceanobacillus sp. CFH 90083]